MHLSSGPRKMIGEQCADTGMDQADKKGPMDAVAASVSYTLNSPLGPPPLSDFEE